MQDIVEPTLDLDCLGYIAFTSTLDANLELSNRSRSQMQQIWIYGLSPRKHCSVRFETPELRDYIRIKHEHQSIEINWRTHSPLPPRRDVQFETP